MRVHRLRAVIAAGIAMLAVLGIAACGDDTDARSHDATERLVARVDALRDAAGTGDATAFAATAGDLRAEVAALRADGTLTDEKAASIEQQLAIVETEFARATPTTPPTTTAAPPPSTTAPPTTEKPDDEPKGRGKGKDNEDDKDDD